MKNHENWDDLFLHGQCDFLHKPDELLQLAVIAQIVGRIAARTGAVEVVDIGCGEGLLLEVLQPADVRRYVGIDVSPVALARIPPSAIDTLRICSPISRWDGKPAPAAPRVLVASEILYYEEEGVEKLRSLSTDGGAIAIIISCVAGRPDKPNWERAANRLWALVDGTGLKVVESCSVSDPVCGTRWDIKRLLP